MDHPVRVDDHRGAVRDAGPAEVDAKGGGDRSLGMEIREQGKGDSAEALTEVGMAVDAVDAHAQHLRMRCVEPGEQRFQRWDFPTSGRGEVQGVEDEHCVL